MKRRILTDSSYTFSKYFDLAFTTADILAELDCRFDRRYLDLPSVSDHPTCLDFLSQTIERNLRVTNPTTETAKRETLIAPILFEVCAEIGLTLQIEYPIMVNDLLKGTLDYYIPTGSGLLVVEAKQADLSRGFTQLAIELIALDQWINSEASCLYGAVTTGEDWRFGRLERSDRRVIQDINLYRVPEGLEQLVKTLIGILQIDQPVLEPVS